jgi:hypothetical protein
MPVREKIVRCVGGPCDGMTYTLKGQNRVSLSAPAVSSGTGAATHGEAAPVDYDVRRLIAPDGKWHEFLVLSAWTSMEAAVWLNRRKRRK